MEFRHEHCNKYFWTDGVARFCPYCGCLISSSEEESELEGAFFEEVFEKVEKPKKKRRKK